jgi:hypothetical protein
VNRSDGGTYDSYGVFERTAKYAKIPLIALDECRAKVGKRVHPDRHLCAGGVKGEGKKLRNWL